MDTKKEGVRASIILPFSIVLLVILGVCAYGGYLLQKYHLNSEVDSKLAGVNNLFQDLIGQEAKTLKAQLGFLSEDAELLNVWQDRNRENLYRVARPIFEKIKNDFSVTHFYFINPDKTCFLRVHTPERYGDVITRHTFRQASNSSKVVHGIELGPLGTFTLRVVYPCIKEGKLIGYLELGEEIEHLTPNLKEISSLDLVFTINKSNLERKKWEEGVKFLGKSDNWEDYDSFVIIDKTVPNIFPQLKTVLRSNHIDASSQRNFIVADRIHRLIATPLIDAGRNNVGKIIAIYNITDKVEALKKLLIKSLLLVLFIGGLLFMFFYHYTGRIAKKLNRYQDDLENLVKERTSELSVVNKKLFTELSERKKIQEDLKLAKDEWEKTFEAIPDIITIQDSDMRIVRANKATYQAFQVEPGELNGKYCYEVFGGNQPCPNCPELETMSDMQTHIANITHENLGKIFNVTSSPMLNENGEPTHIVHIAKDITEHKKMEEELFQAHKMEAIGTLAGGIAHDFNNILTAILGYADIVKEDLPAGSHSKDDIEQVLKAGNRAKELVRQILTFSRKGKEVLEPLQLLPIIKEALKLMRASLPTTIEIQEEIDPNCGSIIANPTNVNQVFMNLCTNALHAMEEEKGILTVKLTRLELTKADLLFEPGVSDGPFVELIIGDTGCGIDKEVIKRIFEPYFTTKDIDKGSGMGLALVHGIVQKCGGFIKVESKPGEGSLFYVYFPAIEEKVVEIEEEEQQEPPRGDERILTVDDEPTIVGFHKAVLERLGYTVTAKTSSLEALEEFRSSPESFDLIITDQTMPGMTGEELVKEILQIRPDIPIILCTGYSSMVSEEKTKRLGTKGFAMKPLEMKELANIVRKALDD